MILPPGRWELMLLQRGFNVPRFESVTRNHTMVGAVQAVREGFSFCTLAGQGRTRDPQLNPTPLTVKLHLTRPFTGILYTCIPTNWKSESPPGLMARRGGLGEPRGCGRVNDCRDQNTPNRNVSPNPD